MPESSDGDKISSHFALRCLPNNPSDADYAACVAILNRNHPDNLTTIGERKEWDQTREPKHFYVRFLMERGGDPLGLASAGHAQWKYHPQRFQMSVEVIPDARRQGVGGALYAAVRDALAPLNPEKLSCHTREDRTDGVQFALSRGFREEMRGFESRLDVTNFDPARFASRRDIPAGQGIEIVMLSELQGEPDWAHRLYELEKVTSEDVPGTEPFSFPSEAEYLRLTLESSNFLPGGYAIARDLGTGEWVGSSGVWKRQADNRLDTGMTGVKRSHRRKGIAFAMKLKVIDYAKSIGCPTISTDNATTNRPMLSINEALGYTKEPAWIVLGHYPHGKQDETV